MRYVPSIALLALVAAAPLGAHSEDVALPFPIDAKCSVPADEHWTRQEKFVWARVCIGEEADFNEEPGYGGNIDPGKPGGLPESRILRSAFLEAILLHSKYRGTLTRRGVRIIGARFTETLNLEHAELRHELWLDRSLLEQGADFSWLRSTALVSLDGVKAHGTLDMNGADLGSLFMSTGAEFEQVVLRRAHIGGNLEGRASKVTGLLDMDSIRVDGNLVANETELKEVNLNHADIGGNLEMIGAKVAADIECDSLRVRVTAFLSRRTEFSGRIACVYANIGNLDLGGGVFHETVDLTETQIGGGLSLASGDSKAQWPNHSMLILRNAKADTIEDFQDAWPDNLDLIGFTYRNLGSEREPMTERPISWFTAWLAKQGYTSGPYEQLASVLRSQGRPAVADEVLYASREHERTEAPPPRRAWLTAIKLSIGYGYHVEWALFWILGFLVAGICTLRFSREGRRNGMPFGIAYSFDMLLPIIRLREWHYTQVDLEGWARYYFYLHKIMGYVLASILIAGLAGLTK